MKPVFFKTPEDFRQWLSKNFNTKDELWVGYYKKATGKPSLTWSESVDQALCFGWIDGIRKSIDAESYTIRFTPRRPKSNWSTVNIKKMKVLIAEGLMTNAGLKAYEKRTENKSETYSYEQKNIKLAPEYEVQIKSNPQAWQFFQKMAPSYKRPSIWWIMSAKREETRLRRLKTLIECSVEGKKIPLLRRKGDK